MKICIPIEEQKGLESITYGHFGSAPYFLIYNTVAKEYEVLNNAYAEHEHGQCNPISPLKEKGVDVVIVAGMGATALMNLQAMNIQVYKIGESTSVKHIISNVDFSKMEMLTTENSCNHHNCH